MIELIELIRKYALTVGEYTLKSGKKSNYYLDCRNLTLTHEGLIAVVTAIHNEIKDMPYTAIGGPSIGADPIVAGLVYSYNTKGFLVRPTAKDHGKSGRIVGPLSVNDQCIIVEDTVTTGSSVLSAIKAVEEFGSKVIHVIAVVDRLEGAKELLADYNYKSLVTIEDLYKATIKENVSNESQKPKAS